MCVYVCVSGGVLKSHEPVSKHTGVIIMSTSNISCDSMALSLTASRGNTTARFRPAS